MFHFSQILVERAKNQPDQIAYQFFSGDSLVPEVLTYSGLYAGASKICFQLRAHQLNSQRALLICKSQRNFVIAFYACLLAGVVAVPAPPPRRKALAHRLQFIVTDSAASAVLFDCDEVAEASFSIDGHALQRFDLRSEANSDIPRETETPNFSEKIAFLQYTSGSTGQPKGVIVTHENLFYNSATIQIGMEITSNSSVLVALPLFHDMGLIGGVLQAMYSGCKSSFLSPAEFIQYPERWLRIIASHRITISGGTNYMYDLAACSVDRSTLGNVDLSDWKVAFCGAEPIRPQTMEIFAKSFREFGFRPEAFYPCYGMAESTLFVTGVKSGVVPRVSVARGSALISCGLPRHDTEILIVNPDTLEPLLEGCIGEIWTRGGSVALGYWMQPELTKQIFHAVPLCGTKEFLRTGDIGYIENGELYVSGRIKDVIILNGKKFSPLDLEVEAEGSHTAICKNGVAAFSLMGEAERLIIVLELQRSWWRKEVEWSGVITAVRDAVNRNYGISVYEVVLIRPGGLPRTSSGKVMRSRCREDYFSGSLNSLNILRLSKSAAPSF